MTAEELKKRINASDWIGEVVRLKKSGHRWIGLCPFHEEKTPSFGVNENGLWHCFGCGKGGDIYSFIEEREGVPFVKAFEIAAKRLGVADAEHWSKGESRISRAKIAAYEVYLELSKMRLKAMWRKLSDERKAIETAFSFLFAGDSEPQEAKALNERLTTIHDALAVIEHYETRLADNPFAFRQKYFKTINQNKNPLEGLLPDLN